MNRRSFFLTGLATTGLLTSFGVAHEGHGLSHVKLTATVTKRRKHILHIALTVFNQGVSGVTICGVAVEGAEVQKLDKLFVPAGALTDSLVRVQFTGDVPGTFTMMVDFGEHGFGPVMVVV